MRGWYNAHIEYQKPFEVPNLPPSFKVGGTDGIGIDFSQSGEDEDAGYSGKGAVIYETIYDNRNNYSEPVRYPDRKHKVFTFPAVQDPEDEKVELKIVSELDEKYIRIGKSSNG